MSLLIIEIDSPQDEAILLSLLPKLNGRVIEKKPIMRKQAFIDVIDRIIESGGAGNSFGDASEWQREIRSWDRVLAGREE
jgi:hypothetical protein